MMADFSSWSRENLVKFAFDASQLIATQKIEIEYLQDDLKACMKAYRDLNLKEDDS
jgi:hypothetical protein